MIACLDVHYDDEWARAAAIVFEHWASAVAAKKYTAVIPWAKKYESGIFYQRELIPLLAVINKIPESIQVYIIDAYCYLSTDREPGLGIYLYQALNGKVPVVGAAKSKFKQADMAQPVFRGQSIRPLYVTAVGISDRQAASNVSGMAGKNRIPDLLRLADRTAREGSYNWA